MKEVWKDVPDYKGYYQVSNLGRIKSLKRSVKGRLNCEKIIKERVLKQATSEKGYLFVGLMKFNKKKVITIHRLVAYAFLNHTSCGHKIVVDHIDNDRTNNKLENLQLISNRENSSKDKKGTSKYTGVSWNKQYSRWVTAIYIDGKSKHLGYFDDEKDASEVYQRELNKIIS